MPRTKERTVNAEGITACCGAYSTFMDEFDDEGTAIGQVECCKGCYEEVFHVY